MNRIILGIFAFGFCFELVHALYCYKCSLVPGDDLCTGPLVMNHTCTGSDVCYSAVGKAAGFVDIELKGCLQKDQCNKTETVDFPGTKSKVYQLTRTCCETNLCNGVRSAAGRLPTATLLPLTLATLTTIIMAKILV